MLCKYVSTGGDAPTRRARSAQPQSSVLPGRETDIDERANREKVMAHLPKTYSDFYLYLNLLELLIYVCEVL